MIPSAVTVPEMPRKVEPRLAWLNSLDDVIAADVLLTADEMHAEGWPRDVIPDGMETLTSYLSATRNS